jgi:hypothetical protein
MKCSVSDK